MVIAVAPAQEVAAKAAIEHIIAISAQKGRAGISGGEDRVIAGIAHHGVLAGQIDDRIVAGAANRC